MEEERREAMHGRWITNATASIFDDYFWAELHLQHKARRPIASFLHAVQKDGSMYNVVTDLADSIRSKFEGMLLPSAISDPQLWAPMLALVPEQEHEHWLSRAFAETIAVEGQFIRRILMPCNEFPRRSLWLIAGDPQKGGMESERLQGTRAIHQILPPWHNMLFQCLGPRAQPKDIQKRREVAADMLAMVREDGDACAGAAAFATSKWATVFKSDLEVVAMTGTCPPMLYDFFSDLSSGWLAHTQYIEGVNGIIKKQKKVAPHMSLRLMSARTMIRRQFPVS